MMPRHFTSVPLMMVLTSFAQAHTPDSPPPFAAIEAAVNSLEAEIAVLRGEVETLGTGQADISSELQDGLDSLNESIRTLGDRIESLINTPTERRWISPLFIATADGSTATQTVDIGVMNPGEEAATVLISLYRGNGEVVTGFSTELYVPPGGMEYYEVDARILSGQIRGWIEIMSDVPVLATGRQRLHLGTERAENTLTFFARD